MIRLRKKSETKRGQVPEPLRATKPLEPPPSLPVDDFRTSLILPGLTRRFSLLRSATGSPIALDELKLKFAEQRARGSQNQVTEEEEDMILEALGRLHAKAVRGRGSHSGEEADNELGSTQTESQDVSSDIPGSPVMSTSARSTRTGTSSVLHSATSSSSLASTRASRQGRRMSNNLFGSGKFRDQAYMLANHSRRGARDKSAVSVTPSDSTMSMSTITSSRAGNASIYSDNQSLRPSTPEGSMYTTSGSAPSSPNNGKTFERHHTAHSPDPSVDYTAESKVLSNRLSRTLSPEGVKRASLALDAAIRELEEEDEVEEEGDDEIVMERSPIAHGLSASRASLHTAAATTVEQGSALPSPEYEAGTALSSDDRLAQEDIQRASPYPRSRTTSPAPRLPGYIPGMPRPMTPRDTSFDSDDQTPSTTPRATSPRLPGSNSPHSPQGVQSLITTVHRNNSVTSMARHSPAPVTPTLTTTPPLFMNRANNGRVTPEDRQRGNSSSSPTTDVFDSPSTIRRRPNSPLSGPAFRPLVTAPLRPNTPSNVTWSVPSNAVAAKALTRNGSVSTHNHNGSSASIHDVGSDILERSKSTSRSLRSPALPDSPWVDQGMSGSNTPLAQGEYRPPSVVSGVDLGSPIQIANRPLRSPTPTHRQKSPTSPTFPEHVSVTNGDGYSPSRRSSKQNHHSSFSLGTSHGLLLSPIANSSRSSMESVGSSYHSWDEDHKKDRLFGLFSSLDQQNSDWHDVSSLDKSSSSTPGTSPYEGLDIEDEVRRQTGLTKSDFVAIQDKLVTTALMKAATPDPRHRPSSIRKRRPSTSQSHYSIGGGDSKPVIPEAQLQESATATSSRAVDHIAKASALLESVVDSIESPRQKASQVLDAESPTTTITATADVPISSPGRRQRALADALFGAEGFEGQAIPAHVPSSSAVLGLSSTQVSLPMHLSSQVDESPLSVSKAAESSTVNLNSRSPTMPNIITPSSGKGSYVDSAQLAMEIRQKAEAATAALRKSPSIPKFSETSGSVPRKRINPRQISSPTLVSASTSMDAIPLRSPPVTSGQAASTNKIGFPFKRLRGTLRAKPVMHELTEETTPYPKDLMPHSAPLSTPTSAPVPSIHVDAVVARAPGLSQAQVSPPLASPPNSAGPGLKSFMARFRKQRATNAYPAPQRQRSTLTTPSTLPSMQYDASADPASHSAPPTKTDFGTPNPVPPLSAPAQGPSQKAHISELQEPTSAQSTASTDEAALKQLFDAASNLGLDQAALNDLIARSPSTSSKSTTWTRLTRMTSVTDSRKSRLQSSMANPLDASHDAHMSEGRPSLEDRSPRPSADFREKRAHRNTARSRGTTDTSANTVVRRTIIFPSDNRSSTLDMNAVMRKQRRESAGANSITSSRSIHDRVPTPPPHKFVGGRRFSNDASPPVPQLPSTFAVNADGIHPPAQVEQSNSTYDSLTQNAGTLDAQGGNGPQAAQTGTIPEAGPALEVIEMANGETIWSIVNGLRDDDGESFYGDRASFVSEYSQHDSSGDGLKLFFKGHEKKSSKGSNASIPTRNKSLHSSGAVRPETKVFFSSPAQIGRLIENLSRGADAGSFNIAPEQGRAQFGHSTSSSFGSETDMRWSVEERLEQMLGSMNPLT